MLLKKMLVEKKIQKKTRTILKVKMFYIRLVKKNYNYNKFKPKILRKSMTNSLSYQ